MHRTYSDAEQLCALVHKLNKSVNIYQLFLSLCFCLLCVFVRLVFVCFYHHLRSAWQQESLQERLTFRMCLVLFVCMSSLELQNQKGKEKHIWERKVRGKMAAYFFFCLKFWSFLSIGRQYPVGISGWVLSDFEFDTWFFYFLLCFNM